MKITYQRHQLANGLRVIAHRDPLTPLVCVNVMYKVGSRNENPVRTGFAHLFEHLMFGGSLNISQYDRYVEVVGGENNAFTNPDITNYYVTVPASALETALWLESDRMLELAFSEESLKVQKAVVAEEFKQRYLNQPYGDVWLLLRPMAYKVHPYQWPTIGKDINHITAATLEDVIAFFRKYYHPSNAILSIAGNIDPEHVFRRVEHWFGDIRKQNIPLRDWDAEPEQTVSRQLEVQRDIPANAWYRSYHMTAKNQPGYYAADLLSDILSGGFSSRFYQQLVREQALFSDLSAFVTGDLDPGLFVIHGKVSEGVKPDRALEALDLELFKILQDSVKERELEKVKNKVESMLRFSALNLSEKALNLAYHEMMGDAEEYNHQIHHYRSVTKEQIREEALRMIRPENGCTLAYFTDTTGSANDY